MAECQRLQGATNTRSSYSDPLLSSSRRGACLHAPFFCLSASSSRDLAGLCGTSQACLAARQARLATSSAYRRHSRLIGGRNKLVPSRDPRIWRRRGLVQEETSSRDDRVARFDDEMSLYGSRQGRVVRRSPDPVLHELVSCRDKPVSRRRRHLRDATGLSDGEASVRCREIPGSDGCASFWVGRQARGAIAPTSLRRDHLAGRAGTLAG
jgi:hypothetical protein